MVEKRFQIYLFANSIFGVIVRILLFFASLSFVYLSINTGLNLKVALSMFAIILINELFLENIAKTRPENKVSKDLKKPQDSLIFSARSMFLSGKSGFDIAKRVINKPSVRFFKEKLGIKDVQDTKVSKEELLTQALEASVFVEGKYITEVDLFASYILLSEDETHYLQNNSLNNDDVINILYWTRRKFKPEKFSHLRFYLTGTGVFDSLVYPWNYELKKYSRDLTWEVLSKRFLPSTIGREKEYDELVVVMSKKKTSNAIIVGESGTGKKSLVEHLAYHSFTGEINAELSHKRVFELLVDKLLSGAGTAGDLEARLNLLLSEIAQGGNAIVFIQNVENIFGGGGFNFDMSGVLDEYLASDKVKIIGTTSPLGFAEHIKNRPSVADAFEEIILEELPQGKTLLLLTEKAREVELKYGISVKYSALKQAVLLSPLFFPDRFSPGRDVDLLEDVASKAKIDKKNAIDGDEIIRTVQGKTRVVLEEPDAREKELLMRFEERLHERVIGQDEAIQAIANAIRRLRSGFKSGERPISVFLFLGPTGVGKTETAKVLATEYFGSPDSMIRLDMSEYQTQDQIKRILGESPGEEVVANALTDKVEKTPFSLILLDEFEKAHPHLLDIFLQVFDEGRLTDDRGKTVSFNNTIIIATSNAGSELIRERIDKGLTTLKDELVDYLLKNNIFKPELINRFDEVIVFRPLTEEEILKISEILLSESLATLSDNGIKLTFDERVISKIAKDAYDATFGARNIRRYIADHIESYLSKMILENKIRKGEEEKLSVDETGNFIVI
ncbi:MAG: hypothetical protein A2868_00150 [Candidatus Levybacteria bacterium RIFCSPHIGHO2_01_FULL_40_15b]|nr:MAG: hypothetical protein A2868_00150 [Candidatus Levybacteria bacterium RIFCSPHIGHO2_01_FULL_40_15b]